MPAQDLGELGPSQGQATVFAWKWYYGVQGLLVWAVLGLAMAIPKANRDRRVLLILIPVAVLLAAWFVLAKALHMASTQQYQFDWLVDCLAVAIAVLWLLADGLGRLPVAVRFICGILLMSAVAVVGARSSFASSSPEAIILPVLFAVIGVVLLMAITITVRQCRRDYSPARFLSRLASWIVVGSVTLLYGYIVVLSVSSSIPLPVGRLLAQFGLVGLILGISLFLFMLPYLVLAMTSPLYRARMQACLGLPPRQEQPADPVSTPL